MTSFRSRSKYGARKVMCDGIMFDSLHEAERYRELKLLERAGKISDLRLQVPYILLPSQKVAGVVVERPVKYIADFVYKEGSTTVVEDAKGVRTKEYILKKKMMLFFHKIAIREV